MTDLIIIGTLSKEEIVNSSPIDKLDRWWFSRVLEMLFFFFLSSGLESLVVTPMYLGVK